MSTKPQYGTAAAVEAMVQRYLDQHQPPDFKLNIVNGAARQDGTWWYVVVQPTPGDVRSHKYADALAEIEDVIQCSEQIDVLLVPTLADD
jgi:hypothetical protein